MKKISVALLVAFVSTLFLTNVNAQEKSTQKINWMTWEEAVKAQGEEPKKLLINVYTGWCRWCKRMDETTFQQPQIAEYLNQYFYPVKFDAEQKGSLEYKGDVFKYVKSGNKGYHELAAQLLRGRLSFPSIVFIDEDMEVIQALPGFKSPEEFEQIITYFAQDYYKSTPWTSYLKSYKPILVSDKH